jgi:uncharacterized protein YrrD
MDFQFGAVVSSRDGIRLGDLHAVVFDRGTGEVRSLVVDPDGAEGDFRLVPIGAVDDADRMEIFVTLSDDQFTNLPRFAEVRNIAPPPTADNLDVDEEELPTSVPDVPAIGAATGIESIAFTPVLEEEIAVPDEDSVIDNGFTVRATDGDVGQVREIVTDDQTNRITYVSVARGTVFEHDVDIPAGWLREIGPDWIGIAADRAAVANLPQV